MRKLIDELTRTLKSFRQQRDDLMLLVPSGDHDVALLLKVLRDIDRDSPADLYLLFDDDFESPEAYVTRLATSLQEEIRLINEATGPESEKLPTIPQEMFDPGRPAIVRLEVGLRYAQALIQPNKGQRYVWAMCPLSIKDPAAYVALLSLLPPQVEIVSWMRGSRIVARVPAEFQLPQSPMARAKRVSVRPFVIPPDAHEQELLAQLNDPQLPQGDRMQAEVQMAYMDSAYGRFEGATKRFRRALAFFQWAEIPAMEGLIINGLGDIARRQNDWKQAHHWYACAVVPAAETGNPMLMATIVQNLAVVAVEQEDWESAEQRYSELADIKRGMFDEVGLAEALEWRGISQEKLGAHDRAVLSWLEGAMVYKVFDMHDRLPLLLDKLRRGYERLEMREELDSFDEDWSS